MRRGLIIICLYIKTYYDTVFILVEQELKNKKNFTHFFLEKVVTHYIDTLWKVLECKDPRMQKILLYKEIYGSCVHFTGFDSGSPTSSVVCVSSVCWPHIWRGTGNWCYKSGLVGKKILILVFNLLLMRASVVDRDQFESQFIIVSFAIIVMQSQY